MPICEASSYQVKPEALGQVTDAAVALAEYVQRHEPGTALYLVWQQADEPTQFMHIAVFDDEEALDVHRASPAVRRFEKICEPVLAGGPIFRVEYDTLSGLEDAPLAAAQNVPFASEILSQGMD